MANQYRKIMAPNDITDTTMPITNNAQDITMTTFRFPSPNSVFFQSLISLSSLLIQSPIMANTINTSPLISIVSFVCSYSRNYPELCCSFAILEVFGPVPGQEMVPQPLQSSGLVTHKNG